MSPTYSRRSFSTSLTTRGDNRLWNVAFLGTDSFSAQTLTALRNDFVSTAPRAVGSLEVVCPPDMPKGRGRKTLPCEVRTLAEGYGLPVHPVTLPSTMKGWSLPETTQQGLPFDVAVVVSFGYFIPARILEALPQGAINAHPSLLPRHRGASPLQTTILSGDSTTGVSIMEVHPKKFDAGRVLSVQTVPIDRDHVRCSELSKKCASLAATMMLDVLANLEQKRSLSQEQDISLVTHAPKIGKGDARVQWSAWSAEELYRRWRAYDTTIGVHCEWDGQRLLLSELAGVVESADLDVNDGDVDAGRVVYHAPTQCFGVQCCDGKWVKITELQAATSRRCTAKAFYNGRRKKLVGDGARFT